MRLILEGTTEEIQKVLHVISGDPKHLIKPLTTTQLADVGLSTEKGKRTDNG